MNTSSRFCGAVAVFAFVLTASAEASAPAGRYVVAGGTVTDIKTKLVWQQTAPSATYTWANAKAYCQNVGGSLGGTGWRLPTIKELQTIVDESRPNPSIDPTAFPVAPAAFFWSSSPVPGSPSLAWDVDFVLGYAASVAMTNAFDVRCVR
jgi:hypothetical protein